MLFNVGLVSILVFHKGMRLLSHGSRVNTFKMNISSVFSTQHATNRKQWDLYVLCTKDPNISRYIPSSIRSVFWGCNQKAVFFSSCPPLSVTSFLLSLAFSPGKAVHTSPTLYLLLLVHQLFKQIYPTTVVHLYMERGGLSFPI